MRTGTLARRRRKGTPNSRCGPTQKDLRDWPPAPLAAASSVSLRRLIINLFCLLFLGLSVASGMFFWEAREEYNRLKQIEAASQRRFAEVDARLREQEKILDRLRNDPAFVEKVIRRRLGYAKPDEFIFRFPE